MKQRFALKKVIASVVAALLGCYVCSYWLLSLNGRFEPDVIGLNGVKSYGWAPAGFVTHFKWHVRLVYFYCPLYLGDIRLWHKSDDALSGQYPTDIVRVEDIGKVYQAWK